MGAMSFSKTGCVLVITLIAHSQELGSNAFLFPQGPGINPSISKYSLDQEGKTLNLDLDISNPEALSIIPRNIGKLYVRNLQLQFGSVAPKIPIKLPGANGPSPQHSSGPFSLKAKNSGSFISQSGTQSLPIANAAWEMIWKEYQPAGSLLCVLDLDRDVVRNSAVLKKGLVYMHFPVWTESGLQVARREKLEYEKLLTLLLKEQDSVMEKMKETKNPLEKAMCLRNAVAANEKVTGARTSRFDSIPIDSDDIMSMGNGLVICTKGTIWRKGTVSDFFGRVEHFLLGLATIKNKSFERSEE